jgi:lysophospholipase L1-like esterase
VLQSGAAIVPGSIVPLTFNDGSTSLTLPPGEGAYSDPVFFPVAAFTRYAVTLDVSGLPDDVSGHDLGLVSNFVAAGAHAGLSDWSPTGFTPINQPDPTKPSYPVYWVAGLDVASPSTVGAVIALGDSITDGRCSTDDAAATVHPDLYNRWTDLLAARLAPTFGVPGKAVVNEGIAGNTVFGGGLGDPALMRLDRDVLFRAGATHVIFLEGTNDIFDDIVATVSAATVTTGLITADELVINRVHEAGLKIVGATILPRGGDPGWTPPMENVRTAVNAWIRTQANFDGVIDFDGLMAAAGAKGKVTGLPAIPNTWACPDLDGVHPNAAGYAAMAGIINLRLFR